METHDHPKKPTSDQLRAARIAGFTTAISHLPQKRRERLLKDYQRLDARREANINRWLVSLGKAEG